MFTIWKQVKVLSLIIHEIAFVEYCLSSADPIKSVENCISESRQNCSSADGKVICYRICSYLAMPWKDAQELCAKHASSLPVIRNKKEQESLEFYMKSLIGGFWTSGQKVIHGKWTWLIDQPFTGRVDKENSDYKTQAILQKDQMLIKENPLNVSWYICQYRGKLCDTKVSLNLTNGCVVLSNDTRSWYAARNACLGEGGDLADLGDGDLKILESHQNIGEGKQYWIGNISWQWKLPNNKSEDVKYSKWSGSEFLLDSNMCISIQASNGEWLARSCNVNNSVICQSEGNMSAGATSVSLTSTLAPTTAPSRSVTESTYVFYSMIGIGVLLIFIFVIFIFLLIRRRQKGAKEIRSSEANTMQSNNDDSVPEEEPTKKTPETRTVSAYEVRGVYSEISSAKNSNKDMENAQSNSHPPSGTVYTSLEFKKDTIIYAEPFKKSKAANAQTQKVGPLGDIYAVPTPKDLSKADTPKAKNQNNDKIYENLENSN